jgi:AAA15 family ATPase/GTPase
MIKSISLANFKSIRNRCDFGLKPYTFIYGPNSAGKSTVIQSIRLLQQSSLDRVPFRNENMNLGNFRNVLSGQGAETGDSGSISIGFGHVENVDPSVKSAGNRTSYSVDSNSQVNIEFQIKENKKLTSDGSGKFSRCIVEFPECSRKLMFSMSEKALKTASNASVNKWMLTGMEGFPEDVNNSLTGNAYATLNKDELSGVIPIMYRQDDLSIHSQLGVDLEYGKRLILQCRRSVEEIRGLLHVPPVRKLPDEVFRLSDKRVADFENSVYSILAERPEAIANVNEFLSRLDVNYVVDFLKPELIGNSHRLDGIGTFSIKGKNSSVSVGFQDVGYGLSQLVPVLASAFSGGRIVAIEQPELHLHPRLQGGIADVLIAAHKLYGSQFIVESHSEGLMLRIQRRIREGVIDPADVGVLYVHPEDSGFSSIFEIGLEDDGFFDREWPQGFFEDRFSDIF